MMDQTYPAASFHPLADEDASVVAAMRAELALTAPSLHDRAAKDPFLTKGVLAAMATLYFDEHDPYDPRASPLHGTQSGLAAVQIHVGTDEVLLDDAHRYATNSRSLGNSVALHAWEGMSHVFPSSTGRLVAADQALDLIGVFLAEQLRQPARVDATKDRG